MNGNNVVSICNNTIADTAGTSRILCDLDSIDISHMESKAGVFLNFLKRLSWMLEKIGMLGYLINVYFWILSNLTLSLSETVRNIMGYRFRFFLFNRILIASITYMESHNILSIYN